MRSLVSFGLLILLLTACQTATSDQKQVGLESNTVLENPFIHSVYIWFKEDVTDEQRAQLFTDTEKLRTIEVVKALYTGKPASTDRPIVERSYDFAIVVHFEDQDGHDSYQEHPTHKALLASHASLWERVMITDVER